MAFKKSQSQIIEEFKIKHGTRYDYSKVKYKGAFIEVKIVCRIHGMFLQKPVVHNQRYGCKKCSSNHLDKNSFIKKAKKLHRNKYSYSKIKYSNKQVKLEIICPTHGSFFQSASSHIRAGGKHNGCPSCKGTTNVKKDFLNKCKNKFKNLYDYSKTTYVNCKTKVTILCKKHGKFKQYPLYHLKGHGCPVCLQEEKLKLKLKTFKEKAIQKHGKTYSYNKTCIVGNKINITCKKHGNFYQNYHDHLHGAGCPDCKSYCRKYSKKAIKWIEHYAYSHRLKNVQHALNGGEYCLPYTRIWVDGFHARSNTVFEFHGSCWHGDPNVYKPIDRPNPYNNKTAKQLYKETLEREALIRSLGYNLVVMWESDFIV